MKYSLFCLALFFICCGTQKSVSVLVISTPLPAGTPVEIIGVGQNIPNNSKLLGRVKIGDSGISTKCAYNVVVAEAQEQARGMGGNLIQITKHKEPGLSSSCHRIECDVYFVKK